ncbi:MAG: adenosylcobalamin-dependent ribonucleoside-diphosphate reductase [Actinomycetota bacterium]|nr:adenosylcobalamin-dependent ribonucleoside-diphosphate reductase [Actinomycetota bacterium]
MKLTANALKVLGARYLLKDDDGRVIETPKQLFERVAKVVAAVDTRFGQDALESEAAFFQLMIAREFLPNSPTLMNAGTEIGQLSACFVLPIEDSIDGIFDSLKNMAIVHKSGGGTGFSFSRIRPNGDAVKTTAGVASGPISFMKIYDAATEIIKQGGRRRGANMGILSVDHPDIIDFVTAKEKEDTLANFNISVAVTDSFMKAVERDEEYWLINPRTHRKVRKLKAKAVFDLITAMAWRTGDPGLIFIDEVNRRHPLARLGLIESTNPCGELPLLSYESCNLGSVNLAEMVVDGAVNWGKLRRVVRLAVHFLDNVIDAGKLPIPEITEITLANRKIGLGVMGFAEMLILLGISYVSEEALELSAKIAGFIEAEALQLSAELAGIRGSFPNFKLSWWPEKGLPELRNATVTTVAPTGTISIIAGTSSGIEPLFAVSYMREAMGDLELLEVNPIFERLAKERGFYSEALIEEIARTGSIQSFDIIPEDIRKLFLTTFDIPGDWHVRVQAAWQQQTDNAVSKTVNLSANATLDDVARIYKLAFELKCKGITVYRYGSKRSQVLYISGEKSRKRREPVRAGAEYAGECAAGECAF